MSRKRKSGIESALDLRLKYRRKVPFNLLSSPDWINSIDDQGDYYSQTTLIDSSVKYKRVNLTNKHEDNSRSKSKDPLFSINSIIHQQENETTNAKIDGRQHSVGSSPMPCLMNVSNDTFKSWQDCNPTLDMVRTLIEYAATSNVPLAGSTKYDPTKTLVLHENKLNNNLRSDSSTKSVFQTNGLIESNGQSWTLSDTMSGQVNESNNLDSVQCRLEKKELWDKFNQLGTEMIITKSGRRMFPVVRVSFSGLDPNARYGVAIDIVPVDSKRYRYAYHKSSWLVAGRAESGVGKEPARLHYHPDSPFHASQLIENDYPTVVSFDKVKLTNNGDERRPTYVVLHSMHKYQPRIHLIKLGGKEADSHHPGDPFGASGWKTFTFPETIFIAVTAYQNQLITRMKIDCNPFAKGFRDTTRLNDTERESIHTLFLRRAIKCNNEIVPCKTSDRNKSTGASKRGQGFHQSNEHLPSLANWITDLAQFNFNPQTTSIDRFGRLPLPQSVDMTNALAAFRAPSPPSQHQDTPSQQHLLAWFHTNFFFLFNQTKQLAMEDGDSSRHSKVSPFNMQNGAFDSGSLKLLESKNSNYLPTAGQLF